MSKRTPLSYKVLGVRLSVLFELYRYRLRHHVAEELLAGAGIAIGVALVFGVLLANTSLSSSAGQLLHAVFGTARLQLTARSANGFDERLAAEAGRLPGVQVASPVLREDVAVAGPRGRERVQLIGVTASLSALESEATRNLGAGALILTGGVVLPSGVAGTVGARAGYPVQVIAGGKIEPIPVRAVFGGQTIGLISASPVLVALLPNAQRLTGLPGRVTEVLIRPKSGAEGLVARELQRLAAGRLDVTPVANELRLLDQATQPIDQSTRLFAAVGLLVGVLLALNAMTLTVPDRRRFVAEIRWHGFTARQVLAILISQAVLLGVASSLVGIALGYALAHLLFHEVPLVLTFAFPISSHQAVSATTVLAALGGGVLAALLAQLPPALDLRSRVADGVARQSGEPGQSIGRATAARLGGAGAALVGVAIAIALLAPALAILSGVLLGAAAVCLVPALVVSTIAVLEPFGDRLRRSMLPLALSEVRATAVRSIVVVGIAAVAVYGSVAMQGARHDLIRGLDNAVVDYLDTADIWVTTSNNTYNVEPFQLGGAEARLARAPGIAAVRTYQGGLLDIGPRRVWLRARSPSAPAMLEASQLLKGDLAVATRRLREGGWVALSSALADELHVRVGDTVALPTPSGTERFSVAAITTNIGWTPGAITIDTTDYRRFWGSARPTALEVDLRPGVSPQAGKRIVQRALLGQRPGLLVQTLAEREAVYRASASQGLKSLGEISTLLLVASALAIAATLSAAIWQRRAHLATLKAQGFVRGQLWRALLLESAILLAAGSALGALLGVLGHALASRWLQATTGFPAPFTFGGLQVVLVFGLVAGVALAVVAIPGYSAARVSPSRNYQW